MFFYDELGQMDDMKLSVLLIAGLATTVVTDFSYADPPSNEASQAAPLDPNEIICKVTPPATGSRIGGGRECLTRIEWDQRKKDAQAALVDKQMHALQTCIRTCF